MSGPRRRKLVIIALASAGLLIPAGLAGAASSLDVQANAPQVAGQPASDTSARFPTNKQNEPTVAVNPTDAQRLLAGSNDEQEQPPCGPGPVRGASAAANDCSFFPGVGTSGIYTSADGGTTWTNRGLLDDQASWKSSNLVSDGDPVIVYGPKPAGTGFSYANGARAYYATLASFKGGQSPYNGGKGGNEFIAVSYSDDNGLTWSAPVLAGGRSNPVTFSDKNAVVADDNPASPGFGRVYVSWTSFRSNGSGSAPIQLSSSGDGAATFSAPQSLTPATNNASTGGRQGSALATGPDGSVYVAFEQFASQYLTISRDLGRSFPKAAPIAGLTDIADPIPGANFRTDSFPSIAADARAGSGLVYVSWATRTAAGGRIVVAASTDRGASWAAPVTVSGGEGYAFFQGLDVAPNGRVDVGYQALVATDPTRYGTGNARIDAYYVQKPAGGAWSAPIRVSTASSDPAASAQNNLAAQFWGDYNTLTSTNGRAWFIDTDSRTGQGCPAIDAYQVLAKAAGIAVEDDEALPKPTGAVLPVAPAPGTRCPAQFGNTDVRVAVITP